MLKGDQEYNTDKLGTKITVDNIEEYIGISETAQTKTWRKYISKVVNPLYYFFP